MLSSKGDFLKNRALAAAGARFFIDFCSQLRPTGSQKSMFFLKEKQGFFKKTPFEDNIDFGFDFGANLPPCWPPKSKIFRNYGLPRGLQNFIVFRIDFLSILAPSWPPTWAHLGGQDGFKSENLLQKNFGARFLRRLCFWTAFKTV